MSNAIVQAVADPEVQKKFRELGLDPTGKCRVASTQISDQSQNQWAKIGKETGFHIDE